MSGKSMTRISALFSGEARLREGKFNGRAGSAGGITARTERLILPVGQLRTIDGNFPYSTARVTSTRANLPAHEEDIDDLVGRHAAYHLCTLGYRRQYRRQAALQHAHPNLD